MGWGGGKCLHSSERVCKDRRDPPGHSGPLRLLDIGRRNDVLIIYDTLSLTL